MDQRFVSLYDEYIQGSLDRRSFVERLTALAGSAAAAAVAVPLIDTRTAEALTVLEVDPRIKTETVAIPGGPLNFSGYLATPSGIGRQAGGARKPGLIIVGENRSINANIKDLARRYATEGFVALAVDYLSPVGGTPVDPELAAQMTFKLKAEDVIAWYKAASKYLKSRPDVGKVGIVGYSWGGGVLNDLIIEDPIIDAAVTYYGRNPSDLKKVGQIRAPLLGHYAALDNTILQQVPAFDAALTAANKTHTFYVYPGTNSGFVNDTVPARWEPVASLLAWNRSLDFLRKHLAS
jgi:carboxymethylenebutenolidase